MITKTEQKYIEKKDFSPNKKWLNEINFLIKK
jgi:hypothetical protein